jgi:predicted transposase/invertase (TIGR01784 family)
LVYTHNSKKNIFEFVWLVYVFFLFLRLHKKTTMAQKSSSKGKTEKTEEVLTKYIDLLTDFGFKRIFGEEANKDLLIDFLNCVLKIEGGVKKLEYGNPERQGRIKTDRKSIFDLYCTIGKGERIIVEMQKLPQTYCKDRALYYVSFPVQEQGEKRKRWNFKLQSVYSVNILNFSFPDKPKKTGKKGKVKKHISYIKLMDEETKEVFYNKLIFVFIELPEFTKTIDELQNNLERWMYVLQHIHKLDDIPAELIENSIFKKLFQLAETANMTRTELNEYNRSLKKSRDMNIYKMEMGMAKRELAKKDRALAKQSNALAQKDNTIATQGNALAQKDNTIAQMDDALQKAFAKIAELEQKIGLN